MSEIKIGDVVQLKSGSVDMTVIEISTGGLEATCAYYKQIEDGVYAPDATQVVYPLSALALV
jgi:uncharacterized protein YodC (DUF2158 family)